MRDWTAYTHFFCWHHPLHSFNHELLEVGLCRVLDNGAGVDNGDNARHDAFANSLRPPSECSVCTLGNGRIERIDTNIIPILAQYCIGEPHVGSLWGDMGCPTVLYVDL